MIVQAPTPAAPPALTVSATATGRWRASRHTGWVALTGVASRPATIRAVATTPRGRRLATARLTAGPDGRFSGRLRLPSRIAPGAVLVATDEPTPPPGSEPLPRRELRLTVAAPPEGVAGRATLTRRRSTLVLVVRMLALPGSAMPVTVRVRRPDGGVRTLRNPVVRGRTITARLALAAPPAGAWTVRLDAGGRPVVLATRRFPAVPAG